jgi:polar amino acid transport system substrate-binding protein
MGIKLGLFHPAAWLLALVWLAGCASSPAGPEARQALAPTGTLRAALYQGTPTSILRGGASGEPRGVGYELGREMARRLGVPYEPVVYPNNAAVLEAVSSGQADVAFTNASPARAKVLDFSAPFLEIELGYLARAASPVALLADVDKPGMRIGVTEHSSSDAVLSRELKNATVVRTKTVKAGAEMLAQGQLDAYATNKATLFEMADSVPGARVLDGRWGLERHAIGVPKGRDAGLPFLRKFAEDVKAEGLVKAAAQRAGLRGAL